MGYRQEYEKYYNVKLSQDMDVHHIDYNHNNDEISNLVAFPRHLHTKLHKVYNNMIQYLNGYTINDIRPYSGEVCNHTLFMMCLTEYLDVLNECTSYMNQRDFLNKTRYLY